MGSRFVAWLWLAAAFSLMFLLASSGWGLLRGWTDAGTLMLSAIANEGTSMAAGAPPESLATLRGFIGEASVPTYVGLLSLLGLAARYAAGIWISLLMYKVFREISTAAVFGARNVGRLRTAGLLVISAELIQICATLLQDFYVRSKLAVPGWHISTFSDRDVHLLFGGLLLLAFARAFGIAAKLRRDSELTI